MKRYSKSQRRRTAPLFATTAIVAAGVFSGFAQASDNYINYPNIFRAFADNIDGIDGLVDIDRDHSYSLNGTPAATNISRLPAVEKTPTLWGEFDHISWPLYLTPADLGETVKVTIVFQNAASVMPEVSSLTLMANGVKVAEEAIQYPASPGSIQVKIPGNTLSIGHNALTLIAQQHHRVDCTAEATYELWTKIDVERSTIEITGNRPRISSFNELAAMPTDNRQALPIRLHYPSVEPFSPWTERSRHYFDMAQKAAIARSTHRVDVRVATAEAVSLHQPALDLFQGTVAELENTPSLARLYDAIEARERVQAAQVNTVFVPSRDRRRTLMFQATEIEHLPDSYQSFVKQKPTGSKRGLLVAETNRYRTYEDTTVSLRELGYLENEFVGRLFTAKFGFRLPADFFPGSYNEISLHLFGLYADGLKPGQRLLIRINGQSEVSLPLSGKRGGAFEDKIMQLELDRFQPGYNEIELVAFLEKPEDDACVTGENIDRTPRFFLSAESYLRIPELAHLGRFPDVATTVSTGFPYREQDGRGAIDVIMSDERPETLNKAAQFVAAMAAKTNHIYDVNPGLPSSVSKSGFARNRLVVGAYNRIPESYAQALGGADITRMATYWENPNIDVASANVDTLKTSALNDDGSISIDLDSALPGSSSIDLLGNQTTGQSGLSMRERFQRQAQQRRDNSSVMVFFGKVFSVVAAPFKALMPQKPDNVELSETASAVAGQVVEGDILTTVIGYAETGDASAPIDGFFTSGAYRDDLVQTAGLHLTDTAVTAVVAERPLLNVVTNTSVRNVRLIIAGWLSNNPIIFGALAILAFLFAGGLTHCVLQRTNRRAGDVYDHLQ